MTTNFNPPSNPAPPVQGRAMAPGHAAGVDRALIERVVDRFYRLVRRDDLIGPIFNSTIPEDHWPAHLAKLADFWSSVLLMTGEYKGKPVPAHAPFALSDEHFLRWLGLFETVVERECPGAAADLFLDRAWRIANSLRLAAIPPGGDGPPRLIDPMKRRSLT